MFRRDGSGHVIVDLGQNRQIIANPGIIREQVTQSSTNNVPNVPLSPFKLVTVRKLSDTSLQQAQEQLQLAQSNLQQAALLSGQPFPYPSLVVASAADLSNVYAVFVDEDIDNNIPVYTFSSPSSLVKAFIIAKGTAPDAYSVHIAHYVTVEKWRIVTIDAQLSTTHFLDSADLNPIFEKGFSLHSLHYLGGGTWTGMHMSDEDKIRVVGKASAEQTQYRRPYLGSGDAYIAHSTTPTATFTWCKGILVQNTRVRDAKVLFDTSLVKTDGVIETTHTSEYRLDLCYRPADNVVKQEYSVNTAIYVGNTNLPVNSPFQSPDYGTDVGRYSLRYYEQQSNIVRPETLNINRIDYTNPEHGSSIPVTTYSSDGIYYVYLDAGEGKGSINHPYEIKKTTGTRGRTHFYPYKYWYTYGKVLNVESIGDKGIYKVFNRQTGVAVRVGTFEEPELSSIPNAIFTPWDAEPPTALFAPSLGELTFSITYYNPPLIGHQGMYYFHLNPQGGNSNDIRIDNISTAPFNPFVGSAGSFTGGADSSTDSLKSFQLIYSQLVGATSGYAAPSLNIGNVTIAGSDTDSVLLRRPTEAQQVQLKSSPLLFPNGLTAGYESVTFDNSNHGTIVKYDGNGDEINTYFY